MRIPSFCHLTYDPVFINLVKKGMMGYAFLDDNTKRKMNCAIEELEEKPKKRGLRLNHGKKSMHNREQTPNEAGERFQLGHTKSEYSSNTKIKVQDYLKYLEY